MFCYSIKVKLLEFTKVRLTKLALADDLPGKALGAG
jgi:hypothetical protein